MCGQAGNFLNAMAKDVVGVETPVPKGKGPHGGHDTPFVFQPMRRMMHLRKGEAEESTNQQPETLSYS